MPTVTVLSSPGGNSGITTPAFSPAATLLDNSPAAISTGSSSPAASTTTVTETTRPAFTPAAEVVNTAPDAGPTSQPARPTATPVPFKPSLLPISAANCCQEFSFAGPGRLVYYDKPPGDNRDGAWSQNLVTGQRQFLVTGWGSFSSDLKLSALLDRPTGTLIIKDLAGNQRLAVFNNLPALVIFSPDNLQMAYLLRLTQQDGPEAPQRFEVWVTDIAGKNARAIWQGRELASLTWRPDNHRLLLTGRDIDNRRFGLWEVDSSLANGSNARLLVESKGLNGVALSSDGRWLAWQVTLQGPERSGVWVAGSEGSAARKLDLTGGFRWSGNVLFYLPTRQPGKTYSSLWKYDPANGSSRQLTDPAQIPLSAALEQWQVSPDGKLMVFRSEQDQRLWLLTFLP